MAGDKSNRTSGRRRRRRPEKDRKRLTQEQEHPIEEQQVQHGHDFSHRMRNTIRQLTVHHSPGQNDDIRLPPEPPKEVSTPARAVLITVTDSFRRREVFDTLGASECIRSFADRRQDSQNRGQENDEKSE